MSDIKSKDVAADFAKKQIAEAEHNKKKSILEKSKVDNQFNQLLKNKKRLDTFSGVSLNKVSDEEIDEVVSEFLSEQNSWDKQRTFILKTFKDIPHGPHQLILIGAPTGDGKSTTAANIALGTIKDGLRVLMITNEESPAHCYNRITGLQRGEYYSPTKKLGDFDKTEYVKNMKVLQNQMRVVHENYGGSTGITTTIEGIINIFENLYKEYKETGQAFDTIIIDYYQNIYISLDNPSLERHQVQAAFCEYINQYKKRYPASFVVLAQVRKDSKDKEGNVKDFKERVEGSKSITTVATCAIEMKADRDNLMTEWLIRKHRWGGEVSQARILTGWDKGLYVEYSLDFMDKVEKIKLEKLGRKENV